MFCRLSFAVLIAWSSAASLQAQVTPPAVLTSTDPQLRLWLRADSLVAAGLTEGAPVKQWLDQSQYGTVMAPRTVSNPNGPLGGFPVEENPHLVYSNINGNNVPTVRFDGEGDVFNTGDPNVDRSGSIDRLYQTNNLDNPNTPGVEFDPLDIGDGSDFTSFIVFNPDFTTGLTATGGPRIGYQTVFAKRGTSSSVYDMAIKNFPNFGNFVVVQYDAVEQYHSGTTPKPAEQVWHLTSITIDDNPGAVGVDVVNILDDESQSDTVKMSSLGVTTANGTPATLIASRNVSTREPFGIGGHSQNCCGEGERFAGNIAELIIFARQLTPQEFVDVENYLDAKYFVTPPVGVPGDYSRNGTVDAADYTLWRDHVSQLVTLSNENPGAVTPGWGDTEDYNFWKSRFGNSGGGQLESIATPEPSAANILLCAGLFASARLRKSLPGSSLATRWPEKC